MNNEKNLLVRALCIIIDIFFVLQILMITPQHIYAENTQYPQVSEETLAEYIKETVKEGHPYLYGRKSDFDKVRGLCLGGDAYLAEQYAKIKAEASSYLGKEPALIDDVNAGYISRSFSGWNIVMLCAFVYIIEGETAYAERAYMESEYFCSLDSWGSLQYIDNNQLATAVALCYDWLYDYLDAQQRNKLSEALKEKHLSPILNLFRNPDNDEYRWAFHQQFFSGGNHGVLNNTATFVQALAISDNCEYSAEIMQHNLKNLEKPLDTIGENPMWFEGVGYWTYVGPFIARMLLAMDSAFGTMLGFDKLSKITDLGYFPVYMQSDTGSFVYCDSGSGIVDDPEIQYFGILTGDDELVNYIKDRKNVYSPLICLWYDTNDSYSDVSSFSKDRRFTAFDSVTKSDALADIATMRSSWEARGGIFTAIMTGRASTSHFHQASGTFTIEALGAKWVANPGRDNYELPGYFDSATESGKRWSYYPTRAEANSCLVIEPDIYGGQNVSSSGEITDFSSGENHAFAIMDLSEVYKEKVISYKRGLSLCDGRSRVILRDEAQLKNASDVYSFINVYSSDIEINDENEVILSKGNKKMLVKFFCDKPFNLSVMKAEAMDASLKAAGQVDFTGQYQRLAVCLKDVSSFNLSVTFVPYYSYETKPVVDGEIAPLNQWNVHRDVENKNFNVRTIFGEVTEDSYIMGGYENYNKNFGNTDNVILKYMREYSAIGYYKAELPQIPDEKEIKSVKLQIHAYKQSDDSREDNLNLYLVDSKAWSENTIVYSNATVKHKYPLSDNKWFPFGIKVGSAWRDVSPDMSERHSFKSSIPAAGIRNDGYYSLEEIDITELFDVENDKEISFVIGMGDTQVTDKGLTYIHIASTEHSDSSIRPRLLVEVCPKVSISEPKIISAQQDTSVVEYDDISEEVAAEENSNICIVAKVTNKNSVQKPFSWFIAQYDKDERLIAINCYSESAPELSSQTYCFNDIYIQKDANKVKSFFMLKSISPLSAKKEWVILSEEQK